MAKNTAKVTVNVINKAQSTNTPPLGIAFVIGETERGIPNDPSVLITSVAQYEKHFGGIQADNDFSLMAEQAILGGASLRVCRVVSQSAYGAAYDVRTDHGDLLFSLYTKGTGLYYSDPSKFIVTITLDPSTSANGYFNLTIQDVDAGITETYTQLKYQKLDSGQTYMKPVIDASQLVTVTYSSSSSATGAVDEGVVPVGTAGHNGDAPVIADYQGNSANKTGLYAFNEFDDGNILSPLYYNPHITLAAMYGAGKAYAEARKDLVFIDHILNSIDASGDIATALSSLTASKYAMVLVGGVQVNDTINGGLKNMLGTGMALGAIATSQNNYGPWYSPTAFTRGLLPAALGVVNNFGSPASQGEREIIANAGGSCIVNKRQQVMLWDAYTMALANSPEKFFSIVQLEIYMVKVLKPLLEFYLGSPNIWNTWERIYYAVLPFLNSLVNDEAIYSYKWSGDQFATSLDDLQINDASDVGKGIYKVQLQFKAVVPIVDVTLNIVLTETSVEFS